MKIHGLSIVFFICAILGLSACNKQEQAAPEAAAPEAPAYQAPSTDYAPEGATDAAPVMEGDGASDSSEAAPAEETPIQ
jgi:hypothetical protein